MNVLVVRDPRESTAKCSLTPLRGSPGVRFVDYAHDRRVEVGCRTLLHPDGAELSAEDAGRDVLLIDCSWRRVDQLLRTIDGELIHRRLPPLITAYPRKSKTFVDPARGLASIEALYAAFLILGKSKPAWIGSYPWRDEFLLANAELLAQAPGS